TRTAAARERTPVPGSVLFSDRRRSAAAGADAWRTDTAETGSARAMGCPSETWDGSVRPAAAADSAGWDPSRDRAPVPERGAFHGTVQTAGAGTRQIPEPPRSAGSCHAAGTD